MIEQNELCAIRKKHKFSQDDIAKLLHIRLRTYQRYEHFETKMPLYMRELLSYKLGMVDESETTP